MPDTSRQDGDVAPLAPAGEEAPAQDVGIERAALLGVLTTFGSAALTMSRAKVTAVYLGPAGVGKVAEILQLVTLANTPGALLMGPALVAGVAAAQGRKDHVAVARMLSTVLLAALATSLLGGVVATVAGVWALPAPWGAAAWPLTALAGLSSVAATAAGVPGQALTGYGKLQRLTVISLITTVLATLLVSLGTIAFGVTGQFIGMTVASVVGIPLCFGIAAPALPRGVLRPRVEFDWVLLRDVARVGATAFVAALAGQSVLFVIRTALEHHGGAALTGQFQAAWGIEAVAFSFVSGALGSYVFPRYAAAPDSRALAREVDDSLRFVIRVAPPILLFGIAFRELAVRILFTRRFSGAAGLLGYFMAADTIRAVGWILAGPLLFRSQLRAYVVTETVAAGVFAGGAALLVPRFGLVGVGVAFLACHAANALIASAQLLRACNVRVSPRRLVAPALVCAIGFAALALERRTILVKPVLVVVSLTWMARVGLIAQFVDRFRALVRRLRPARRGPGTKAA